MTEFVDIEHPDIQGRGRVARSALPYLGPGWRVVGEPETPVGFDPSAHKVPAVLEYLATADVDEQRRVIDAEKAGKARASVLAFTTDAEPSPEG